MTRLRFWISISFLWLAVLFNIERLHEPFNIASFVYVLAGALGILTLTLTPATRVQASWFVLVATAVFLASKVFLGYRVGGTALPLTVTEAIAIITTVVLARQIALSIRQFEDSVFEVAALHWVNRPLSFKEMQHEFYREVRRARRFNRPVSLLVLTPNNNGISPAENRLMNEIHEKMERHYLDVRIANLLASEIHDCDLVAKCNDEFVVLLPEADAPSARETVQRLAQHVHEALGTEIKAGIASFPGQEVTFSGLLKRAQTEKQSVSEGSQAARSSNPVSDPQACGGPRYTQADADLAAASSSSSHARH